MGPRWYSTGTSLTLYDYIYDYVYSSLFYKEVLIPTRKQTVKSGPQGPIESSDNFN